MQPTTITNERKHPNDNSLNDEEMKEMQSL